jgi:Reversibly glycosylated polypeptide
MGKRLAVVLTTINVPHVVGRYAENFARFGHAGDAYMIVIPDLKTPEGAGEVAARAAGRFGFEVDYVTLPRQEAWLARFPDLKALIPYNTDNRRNVGFLLAAERGCDVLVSIDDDNFCLADEDFYAGHSVAGSYETRPTLSTDTGWFNICTLLDNSHGRVIYPRGYPYSKRVRREVVTEELTTGYVAVNAGLWLNDPDVDAVTRLNEDVKTTRLNRAPVMLSPRARSPVSSQNTAVAAEALAAYYYVLMGERINGQTLDRYGDIWSGYFLGKCAEHLGHRVAVGTPLAYHERNQHDLFLDLRQELWGMILTESLVKIIDRIALRGDTYEAAYADLASKLERAVLDEDDRLFNEEVRAYFRKIAGAMRVWVDVCKELGKG